MNSHKILRKTSILKWIQILLCIAPLLGPSWARLVTYNETKFQIFENKVTVFESKIFETLQTTKNFFAQKEVANFVLFGLGATAYLPTLAPIAGLAFVFRAFLASESDWRESFAKTIAHETRREVASSELRWMEATVTSIESKIGLMMSNETAWDTRQRVASIIHYDIDKTLNFFLSGNSLFKKYPLLGSPLLIVLGQLVAFIDPMAKHLIADEARKPELSCKMRTILQDYRPRTVYARLEKLHVDSALIWRAYFVVTLNILFNVMAAAFNKHGYKRFHTNDTMSCEKDCDPNGFELISRDPQYFRGSRHTKTYSKPNTSCYPYCNACLEDDFSVDNYYFPPYDCLRDYGLLIRHRVEQLFPVDLLNMLCAKQPQITGSGWITVHIKAIRALRRWDDMPCEVWVDNPCDPFIQLFIDGELQLQTPVAEDTELIDDVDVIHTSKKIAKNTIIKIEVWDNDYGLFGKANKDLVIRTEGNVDSFLKQGHRGVKVKGGENYVNTISFWQDEYKY